MAWSILGMGILVLGGGFTSFWTGIAGSPEHNSVKRMELN